MAKLTSEKDRLQSLTEQAGELLQSAQAQRSSPVWPWAQRFINAGRLGGDDWLNDERPKPTPALLKWDREGRDHLLIPAGRVGLLVAPGGTGKSSLLCQLAITVATGRPWLSTYSLEGKPGRVLLIMGEEDQDEIKRKLYDAARPRGRAEQDKGINAIWGEGAPHELTDHQRDLVYGNIDCLPLSGIAAPLLEADSQGLPQGSPFAAWLSEQLTKAAEAKHPYRLIIMDPLSRMLGAAAENDNGLATRFIQELEKLTQTQGAPTVLIAHHANKGAMNQAHSGEATNQGAARGASAFVDGARLMINLEPCPPPDEFEQGWGGTRITMRVTKSNYGPTPPPLELFWPTGERVFRPASDDELKRWANEEQRLKQLAKDAKASKPKDKATDKSPRGLEL